MANKTKFKDIKFKSDFNIEECYKLTKYFPKYKNSIRIKLGIKYLIFSLVFSLCFCYINLMFGIGLFVFLLIGFTVSIVLDFEHSSKKTIQNYIKKNKYKDMFENTIKENKIVRKNGDITITHDFENISDVIISDNDIFMFDKKYKSYIIIQKKYINYNIIEFIKKSFDNVKVIKDKDLNNDKLTTEQKKKIKIILTIIFILNLVLPFIAGSITNAVIKSNEIIADYDKINSMFIFWLFIPIPVVSIVLGLYYKKKKIKTLPNIVLGFIILIYLLLVGCAFLIPIQKLDYKDVNKYKNIISIKLPKDGKFELKKLGNESNITDYKVYTLYFKTSDAKKIIKEIKDEEAWFPKKELKTYLKTITNNNNNYFDADYYSIYNKTSDEYNVLPTDNGKYDMFVMKYHKDRNTITIEKFKYNYKN